MTLIIFAHRIANAYTVKILNLMKSSRPEMFTSGGCFCFVAIEFYVFLVEAFQFSKFHENVDQLDRGNFKRGFTMTFMVKNS